MNMSDIVTAWASFYGLFLFLEFRITKPHVFRLQIYTIKEQRQHSVTIASTDIYTENSRIPVRVLQKPSLPS